MVRAGTNSTYEVHVINALPADSPPVNVHCASKNDEIGYHTLHVNDDLTWSFKTPFIGNTLYFCRFKWNGRDKAFVVFDQQNAIECQRKPFAKKYLCYWFVKDDGFYFQDHYTNNPSEWIKKKNWTIKPDGPKLESRPQTGPRRAGGAQMWTLGQPRSSLHIKLGYPQGPALRARHLDV
ncbi:hypothetical protein RJ639_038504 [Escallonia herrerae]|uniref:S-protein homolog n=1 Tax=Escallonia herrerae TaxID=1293975 RepID=A0AA88WPZ3_9ASTE|nr:hypothetical protein RJ639_038504 [Escallonia herrerae]